MIDPPYPMNAPAIVAGTDFQLSFRRQSSQVIQSPLDIDGGAERENGTKAELGFPDASDGARVVAFVESAMRSFASGGI